MTVVNRRLRVRRDLFYFLIGRNKIDLYIITYRAIAKVGKKSYSVARKNSIDIFHVPMILYSLTLTHSSTIIETKSSKFNINRSIVLT